MRLLTVLFFFLPTVCFASGENSFFAGAGLNLDSLTLEALGNGASRFLSQGYVAEVGKQFKFGGTISLQYGLSNAINRFSSQTYMETGTLNHYAAKFGYDFEILSVGFGYQYSDLNLKSLSLSNSSYFQSRYSGGTPMIYAALKFKGPKNWGFTAKAQYITGTLKNSNDSLPNLQMDNLTISLRLIRFFDRL
jgi:hypothetical protein